MQSVFFLVFKLDPGTVFPTLEPEERMETDLQRKSEVYFPICCSLFWTDNVNSTLTFVTLSGELKATRAEDGIVMDFPLYPAHPQVSSCQVLPSALYNHQPAYLKMILSPFPHLGRP